MGRFWPGADMWRCMAKREPVPCLCQDDHLLEEIHMCVANAWARSSRSCVYDAHCRGAQIDQARDLLLVRHRSATAADRASLAARRLAFTSHSSRSSILTTS